MAALVSLVLPASVIAATRYASPAGATATGCPPAEPCSLTYAITAASPNDEVIVTPGTYDLSAGIETETPLMIRGQAAQPRPRIIGAPGITPFRSFKRQTISDLTLEASEASEGVIFAPANGTVFDHLELIARGTGALALRPGNNFSLSDSLLLADGKNASGLFLQGTEENTAQLRNDTVIANGTGSLGISIFVTGASSTVTIDATNVIAQAATDASAGAKAGSMGVIAFDHSNFDTSKGQVTATASQTAPPTFIDSASGDYRETAGSPTIDAGLNDPADGATDLLGNPRTLPAILTCTPPAPAAVTDIGAYEYVPSTPLCPPPTVGSPPLLTPNAVSPLVTKITAAKVQGHRARFRFIGSGGVLGAVLDFSCKLDRRPWRTCRSPKGYRHLKVGRHTFRVRASSDGASPSAPAERHFKIEPPRRDHQRS